MIDIPLKTPVTLRRIYINLGGRLRKIFAKSCRSISYRSVCFQPTLICFKLLKITLFDHNKQFYLVITNVFSVSRSNSGIFFSREIFQSLKNILSTNRLLIIWVASLCLLKLLTKITVK